jgi:exopolysaccharide biosynthesis polyprenyl glycosylphosphotransferase
MIRASALAVLLLVVSDLALVAAAFLTAYVLRFQLGVLALTHVEQPPSMGEYARALVVIGLVFLVVFRARGLYRALPPRGFDVLEGTLSALNLATLVVLATTFFYREFSYSRSACLIAWFLLSMALPLPRLAMLQRRRRAYRRGEGLVPALIVGANQRALSLYRRLRDHRRYGLEVRGVVTGPGEEPPEEIPTLGTTAELDQVLSGSQVREVLVPDTLDRLELLEVIEVCGQHDLPVRIVPRIYDLFVTSRDLSELYGVPFVSVREARSEWASLALKRVFDLIAGTLLLLLSLPLILLLMLIVRLESKGPALFVQRRIGQGGRPFDMWKLRSMVVDAPERLAELVDLATLDQPVYKLEDDPRVTRVGRFIRRWSLDELPQLFNVVLGSMSLVGPRPETAEVVSHYDAHQRRRLKAKPGLTGLQQIEARDSLDLDERIQLDVYYIRRRSFLFDLWLLARTPWAVIHGRGAR